MKGIPWTASCSSKAIETLSKHKKLFSLLVLLALLGIARLFLPYFVKRYVNQELNRDPLYRGSVADVEIHLWRGAYSLDFLKIERIQGQAAFPLLSASKIDIGISWKELMHSSFLMKLVVQNFEINIVREPEEGQKKVVVGELSKAGKKEEAHGWRDTFKKLVPIDVGRLTIEGGDIHYRDLTSKPKVDVYLDHLQITGENLTNSSKISKNLFGTFEINARVMESGDLNLQLYIDPMSSPPEFKMITRVQKLNLVKLNDFFTAYGNFDVKQGTIGIYSEMATVNKKVKGYVKPIIRELKVSDFKKDQKKGGLLHAAWEAVVGAIGIIFKNHKKDQQAAKIYFEGRLDDPKMSGWQVAESVLYNMFIKPIAPGVENSIKLQDVKKVKTQ